MGDEKKWGTPNFPLMPLNIPNPKSKCHKCESFKTRDKMNELGNYCLECYNKPNKKASNDQAFQSGWSMVKASMAEAGVLEE